MVVKLKHKLSIYRKFELDIWGISKTTHFLNFFDKKEKAKYKFSFRNRIRSICSKYELICKFFYDLKELKFERWKQSHKILTYSLLYEKKQKRRKRLKDEFVRIRIIKMFYLILKYRQFRRLSRKASRREGYFEANFLYLLECRLICALYRSTLFSNMFELVKFVKTNNVWINKFYINHPNYYVKLLQLVGFRPLIKGLLHWNFLRRLKLKSVLFNRPRYIYLSYTFFTFFLKRFPRKSDLIFPVHMDVYRLSGYCK